MVILLVRDRENHNKEVKQQNGPVNRQIEDVKKTKHEGDECPHEKALPEFEFSDFSDDWLVFTGTVESGLFHLLGDVVHFFLVFLELGLVSKRNGGLNSNHFTVIGLDRYRRRGIEIASRRISNSAQLISTKPSLISIKPRYSKAKAQNSKLSPGIYF